VESCKKYDPKGTIFGTGPVPSPSTAATGEAKRKLVERVGGKKFLITSGGADKLVPYRCGKAFLSWFKEAAADGSFSVENNIYDGIGHSFSADMVKDAIRFVVDEVTSADDQRSARI
jgi:predicted esterase